MKKFIICFFALSIGFGAFAQKKGTNYPKEEKVTITEEKIFDEVDAEKEAKAFTDMMAETSEITTDQKDKIYKVVLKAMKEKKALAALREKDEAKFKEKENALFKKMNDEVSAIIAN